MATKDAIHPASVTRGGDPFAGLSDSPRPEQPTGGRRFFMGFDMRTVTGNISEDHLEKITLNLAVYGAGLVLVGLVGIIFPIIFTMEMAKFMSWLLVLGGAMAVLQFFLMCGAPGTSSFLLLGALHLFFGLLILIHPLRSGNLLILVISTWFLLHGVLKVVMAFQLRSLATWPALMTSGFLAVVLAFVVLVLAPRFGLVMLSIVFGTDLLLSGLSLLLLSCMAHFGRGAVSTVIGPAPAGVREPLMSHAAASA